MRARRTTFLALAIAASAAPIVPLAARTDILGGPVPAAASTAGLLGALLIWWQCALGIRHVSLFLVPDRGVAVAVHAVLGSAGAFFVLVHPLLEMFADRRGLAYLVTLDFRFGEAADISLGRIALLVFVALWLTSTLLRAALRHRWWRWVHYLSYPLGVLVFLHADALGTLLLSLPWLRGYWYALAVTFAAMCAYRLLAPLRAPRYRLIERTRLDGGATRFRLAPLGRALRPASGQFIALRTHPLLPAHPFSAIDVTDDGTLDLAIAHVGPFTRRLRRLRPGATVRLDGPYGTFTAEAGDSPAVLLAGGIGVTPFVRLAREHPRAVLYHVNREPPVLGAELAADLGPRYVPVTRSPEPVPGTRPGRFHVRQAVGDPAARYFVCGSPRFVDGVRSDLLAAGVSRTRVHTERFDS
jgi:predicted ferric reductase